MNDINNSPPLSKRMKLMPTEEVNNMFHEDVESRNLEDSKSLLFRDNLYINNETQMEEMDKLREFQVLDEVRSNDEDSEKHNSDSSDEKSEGVPDEEIEKMLEEDFQEGQKEAAKPREKLYVTKQKIVLEEKGVNQFEVLPLDWMMVRHYSGMPVYLHRATRVCTLAKPYFLGEGSARRHDIPLSAIPCLNYRRALEEEEKQRDADMRAAEQMDNDIQPSNNNANDISTAVTSTNDVLDNDNICSTKLDDRKRKCPMNNDIVHTSKETNDDGKTDTAGVEANENSGAVSVANEEQSVSSTNLGGGGLKSSLLPHRRGIPKPRVEAANNNWKSQHLNYEQVNQYCARLFRFKTVNIKHFQRWVDRHKYMKASKALQYPALPAGTKLVTIPSNNTEAGGTSKAGKRDWVMNINSCSYLSVFHEYVHRALQKQPIYQFQQLENPTTPYQATVFIDGMQYGAGSGSSKRQAKAAAAKASLQILIPEMKDETPPDNNEPDLSFFECVGIEDPRVTEFCAATCEPSPHAILRTCLLRNFGAGDRHIQIEIEKLEINKIEMKMTVGKHSATVVCKNKKTAKQRASQAILQALHPQVRSWGSLLRLYGSRSVKSCKEKKLEEQQITLLQSHATQNQPNHAVLSKLREEMRRLAERDAAVVPIGTLLLTHEGLPTHSGANLANLDL